MSARILIVEDDWLIASEYVRILTAARYVILGPYPKVAPALAALAEQAVDAALLDLHLGAENSLAIAVALKDGGIPFAFVTGHQAADLPKDLAGRLVIPKPVAHELLLDHVSKMLAA